MNKGTFSEIWDGLPPWAKGVTIIGTLGIVAFAGYKTYSYFSTKSALQNQQNTIDNANSDLSKLQTEGMQASYIGDQYSTWANELQEAMNSCGQDGWEQTVFGVFNQMKNLVDVLALISAFGVQTLNPCWYRHPVNEIESWFTSTSFSGNLNWWLQQCLSTQDFATINAQLASQGINYTFE